MTDPVATDPRRISGPACVVMLRWMLWCLVPFAISTVVAVVVVLVGVGDETSWVALIVWVTCGVVVAGLLAAAMVQGVREARAGYRTIAYRSTLPLVVDVGRARRH
ncbi:hypothetical protein ACFT5B_06320 [Luteimicrobium sp. NPDC057192]|uniref:hypothetical protein n=1 Tax=Luteimicrobium sp. NPDC057192 TaxID=3346042 RepID=UPI0036421AEF